MSSPIETIYIRQEKIEELKELYSGDTIGQNGKLRGVGRVNNQDICITGYGGGSISACYLIQRSKYQGELKPLPYHEHNREVNKGNRKRGYKGMQVTYRNLVYICGDQVRIGSSQENQLELF